MANPLNRYEFAGAYDPRIVADYITRSASERGVDPDIALRVARSEGLNVYTGDQGSSFGPFQLHYGNVAGGGNKVGGLGDVFTRQTGLDARDPRTWQRQVDFALDQAKQGGWGPWHGWKGDKWAGIAGDHPRGTSQPMYETGRFVPQEGPLMVAPARAPLPPGALSSQPMAYAEAPEQPAFPPLKVAQAQQAAEPQMEDFFAGTHFNAPQNQVAPTQQAASQAAPVQAAPSYAYEDFFSGNYKKPEAAAPTQAAPSVPPQAEKVFAVPQGEWGPGREIARGAVSGLTAGAGDLTRAGATVRAGFEALTGQAPEGFFERRRNIVRDLEAQRRRYEEAHPLESGFATAAGAGLGTALPMGLGIKAAGAGARALGAAVPQVAPAVEGVAGFLGGKGSALWGLPSKAAHGALYGTGETALTQQLLPEEERGMESLKRGAGAGAVVNAALGTLGAPISKILKAQLNENLVPLAKKANEKYGLGIRAGQVARDAEVKNLDEMLVPQHVHDKQIQKFSDAVAKELDMGGKPLTNTNITKQMETIGKEISGTVAGKSIPVTGGNGAYTGLVRDVNKIFQGVAGRINPGDPEAAQINNFLRGLRAAFSSGQMSGEMLQNYIGNNGRIANAFRNTGRSALNGVEHDLREAFLNAFETAHPNVAPRFREAREIYKKLAAVDNIVAGSESGYIDPTRLLAQVEKRNIGGNLRELASIGEHMPGVNPQGAARVRSPGGLYRGAAEAASIGVPIAEALGAAIPFGNLVSKFATGQLLSEWAQGQALKSPLLTKARFLHPELSGEAGQHIGNILVGGPTAFGAGAGGMEKRK